MFIIYVLKDGCVDFLHVVHNKLEAKRRFHESYKEYLDSKLFEVKMFDPYKVIVLNNHVGWMSTSQSHCCSIHMQEFVPEYDSDSDSEPEYDADSDSDTEDKEEELLKKKNC
jgi:hypothetical protein